MKVKCWKVSCTVSDDRSAKKEHHIGRQAEWRKTPPLRASNSGISRQIANDYDDYANSRASFVGSRKASISDGEIFDNCDTCDDLHITGPWKDSDVTCCTRQREVVSYCPCNNQRLHCDSEEDASRCKCGKSSSLYVSSVSVARTPMNEDEESLSSSHSIARFIISRSSSGRSFQRPLANSDCESDYGHVGSQSGCRSERRNRMNDRSSPWLARRNTARSTSKKYNSKLLQSSSNENNETRGRSVMTKNKSRNYRPDSVDSYNSASKLSMKRYDQWDYRANISELNGNESKTTMIDHEYWSSNDDARTTRSYDHQHSNESRAQSCKCCDILSKRETELDSWLSATQRNNH